jgi:uncharacterized delta-60 repeat protein
MKLTLRMITSVASLMLACVAPAAAAPGDLDSSFGDGGRVTTSFGGGDDFASDVVVQPDGRIVVAGSTAVGGTQDFALARYLSDGSPDRSFSDDGRVTTAFPTGEGLERASGVALQPDGKIVASGGAGEFAVARYNVDGTLDTTFSGDGLQTVDVGTYESSASDVAVDALGRIILVGVGRNFDPVNFMDSAVARLAPDGSPDMTFGYNGVYTLDLSGEGLEHLGAVAPLPDGGFTVTGGSAYIGAPPPELVTRRFAQSGDEVEGFNRSREGRLVASGEAIDVQADGRTVIAGGARTRGVGVLRLLPDGSYDRSFSGDGEDSARIVAGAPGIESGRSVAVQTSRRIVVGAVAYAEDGGQLEGLAFGLLRFRPDGGLDTSFAGDGRQATRFGAGSSSLSAVALQGSRILAVGTAGLGSGDADFALAGYDGRVAEPSPLGRDGAPDSNIRRLRRPVRPGRSLRIRGTASDDHDVAKVEVALRRVRASQRRRRRCSWLRTRRSAFTRRVPSGSARCSRLRRFIRADGTDRWRLALPRGLPAGRYVVFSRATDDRGARERRFSARDRNRLAFTVRRKRSSARRPSDA